MQYRLFWRLGCGLALLAAAVADAQTRGEGSAAENGRPAVDQEARASGPGEQEASPPQRRPVTRGEATLELGGKTLKVAYGLVKTEAGDYARLALLKEGEIVQFAGHGAIKLSTELDLTFGQQRIEAGNVAVNYPGVYSLWLKRAGGGWRLVFNGKPDVWGTQHDPGADVAEVALVSQAAEQPSEVLGAKLLEVGDGGLLVLTWGTHEWLTEFAPSAAR